MTRNNYATSSSCFDMMYKIEDAINILLDCLFLPWNFNCFFTSRSDNYFVFSGHKERFLLKSKSTVSHQLSGPTMLLALESQICVVIVLQKEFNRTMT
jgi:hypothetical protein